MSVEINEEFAAALRAMLVQEAQAGRARPRLLKWPRTVGLRVLLAGVVVTAGGGAAAATGVFSLPASTVTTQLATAVTVTGSGTEAINLGPQPQGANAISLTFSCLTPGWFVFADGSSEKCSARDLQHPTTSTATLPLAVGQVTTVITAGPGERWRATAFYASTTRLPYSTNASGQTYGVDGGQAGSPVHEPDLVAVQATNGKLGYVYASQLDGPTPTSPAQAVAENNQPARTIPVYESDGKTMIGQFKVGN